jgi:hypothetical protein
MSPNVTAFSWAAKAEQAAGLVADDTLPDEQIAQALGITKRTLERWKLHPDFAARVAGLVQSARDAVKAEGIANKQNRIAALQDEHDRIAQLIAARAGDLAGEVAGGDTGLLVRTAKVVKVFEIEQPKRNGVPLPGPPVTIPQKRVEIVYEYAADVALLRESRATLEQAAKELGQWTEKQEVTGKDGEPLFKVYAGVDVDDV